MDILEIDGSFGEGGGQIVRTAVSLSCITNKPVKIENIRKNRKVPGLKPQHLTALKILKKICSADVQPLKIKSTSLQFFPKKVESCTLNEDVGTAGSISLIIQVLIPVISICQNKLKLKIKGGTDVLWSPTIDYSQVLLKEVYRRMGINFSIKLIKRGYYPKGGGIIELEVEPAKRIIPINLSNRKTRIVKLSCSFSKIHFDIINDEIKGLEKKLTENNFVVKKEIKEEKALDAGATLLIASIDDHSIIGIDSLFDLKKKKFGLDLSGFIKNNQSVDENLADMVVLPASLAEGMSIFQVDKISKHLETNLFVASKITGCKYGIGKLQDGYEIRIQGVSNSSIK